LKPKPSLKIPFTLPDVLLLLQPFFAPYGSLPAEVLYHRQVMKPDRTVTELNEG
jgi:hypothetical protein